MTYLTVMDIKNTDNLICIDEASAFILGNGPSLRAVSLPTLSGYATVGLNAAYRYWHEIDWRPRYYACLDLVVGMSHKNGIAELIHEGRIEGFLLRENLIEALGEQACDERIENFDALRLDFPLHFVDPPTTGSHAALWMALKGYSQIVMLGVDARYKEVVEGAARRDGIELEIVQDGDNPNYFFEGYQVPGDRYNLPNPRPDLHLTAWRHAGAVLAGKGVQIFNANKESAIRCFPFIELDAFLTLGAKPAPAEERPPVLAASALQESARNRLRSFASAWGRKLVAVAGLIIGTLSVWVFNTDPPVAQVGMASVLVLALFACATAVVYVRFTILAHLRRQDLEITALKARIADINRRTRRR